MVELSTALTSEDTRLVELEVLLVGLDGDGDGLLGKSRHHSIVRLGGDVSVALGSDVGVRSALVLLALARLAGSTRGVRVILLRADTTVLGSPVEGVVHETTVAAHVLTTVLTVVTRHEVLLGEGLKGSVLQEVSTLKSTSGGERPAGTALALVLDASDGSLGGPVDRVGGGANLVHLGTSLLSVHEAKLNVLLVLLGAQVREVVVAQRVGLALGVVGVDVILVVSEVLQHLHEVHAVNGLDLVGLEPVEELLLIKGAVVHVGGDSGGL